MVVVLSEKLSPNEAVRFDNILSERGVYFISSYQKIKLLSERNFREGQVNTPGAEYRNRDIKSLESDYSRRGIIIADNLTVDELVSLGQGLMSRSYVESVEGVYTDGSERQLYQTILGLSIAEAQQSN